MTRYDQGANFERDVKKELEKLGLFAVRSAGSRGPIDVVAIDTIKNAKWNKGSNKIWLIQNKKRGRIAKKQIRFLKRLAKLIPWANLLLASKDEDGLIVYENISRRIKN